MNKEVSETVSLRETRYFLKNGFIVEAIEAKNILMESLLGTNKDKKYNVQLVHEVEMNGVVVSRCIVALANIMNEKELNDYIKKMENENIEIEV